MNAPMKAMMAARALENERFSGVDDELGPEDKTPVLRESIPEMLKRRAAEGDSLAASMLVQLCIKAPRNKRTKSTH